MKWERTLLLFDRGGIGRSKDWADIHRSYVRAIRSIDFPPGSGKLTLRRIRKAKVGGRKREFRNGVPYLRSRFLRYIVEVEKWSAEVNAGLAMSRNSVQVTDYPTLKPRTEPVTSNFGKFDLVTTTPKGMDVAIEWETGNISSSHRSMNKLAIALMSGRIDCGVLIVPSRALYEQLTDRIGNIGELSGYLAMWQTLARNVKKGLLAISVVEHDDLTDNAEHPYLPVGTDGNARRSKLRR